MSDNIDVTPGTGKTVRTIEKNSKEVQVIQVDVGAATEENLLVKGQAAAADSLPVALSSDQTGAAGTPAAQVISIQGIANMTPVKTDGSAVTQPVSAAALPLPAGAATEATLLDIKTGISNLSPNPTLDHTAPESPGAVRLSDGAAFFKPTTPSDTQPVSAAALPLPAGAATEATLLEIKTGLSNLTPGSASDHTTPESPASVRLSDGAAFFKPTTPSDTQPASVADGADVAGGAKTDSAVVTDVPGSRNSFLRGLVKIFADIWDTTLHAFRLEGLGTAGIPAGGVLSVQGAASMTPVTTAVKASVSIDVNPNLTVHASYVNGDYVGASAAPMTMAGAANYNGGGGTFSITLVDTAAQSVPGEVWIFDSPITPPADSAPWSISDSDSANIVTVVPINTYYASALNSIGVPPQPLYPFKCAATGTSLYACYVTRGAPTYAAKDLTFRFVFWPD
jgi:hypothetical protein